MASLIEEGVPGLTSNSSKAGSAGSDTLQNDKSGLAACDPYLGAGASGQTTSSPILGDGLVATGAPQYLAAPLPGVTVLVLLWMGLRVMASQQPFHQMVLHQPQPEDCQHHLWFSRATAPPEGNRLSQQVFQCNQYP
uniref:Uncharacterized protein n=1 Tax=Sphaerodactylus townsendi TaxID=933632 RepID=A0ACB8ELY0_9SAUR